MKTIITIIRAAIGWHFLYEGCIKLFAGGGWSAASYLSYTKGFLSGFYHWLASPALIGVVDFLNVWGLILIGLALFLGLFVRWASLAGALLLMLYYFAYPPFGISLLGSSGLAYIINPLFIEASILVFFICYREKGYGLHNLCRDVARRVFSGTDTDAAGHVSTNTVNSRREMLKDLAALPALGLLGWGASRSSKIYGVDTMSGATIQINQVALNELKGELPKGKLGKHEITRMIMGGNQIVGHAHARDLLYVRNLFKAYNTEKKIYDTIMLGEQAGINCINLAFSAMQTIVKYKKLTGSKIKSIVHVGINEKADDVYENVDIAIDNGIEIIQLFGGQCDELVRDNKLELIDGILKRIRSNGVVAGLCAHSIYSLKACEENGIIPDFFMKTMHHDNYWSAHPRENREPFQEIDWRISNDHNTHHDNMWDCFPDQTVEFVNRTQVPIIGFKVMAAGAIPAKDGFNWAFENGADFICVGMFDFQVVDNVNICIDTLKNLKNRKREWYS